jgi:hypothetical protein
MMCGQQRLLNVCGPRLPNSWSDRLTERAASAASVDFVHVVAVSCSLRTRTHFSPQALRPTLVLFPTRARARLGACTCRTMHAACWFVVVLLLVLVAAAGTVVSALADDDGNAAVGAEAFVGGGRVNSAIGSASTITGGEGNVALATCV